MVGDCPTPPVTPVTDFTPAVEVRDGVSTGRGGVVPLGLCLLGATVAGVRCYFVTPSVTSQSAPPLTLPHYHHPKCVSGVGTTGPWVTEFRVSEPLRVRPRGRGGWGGVDPLAEGSQSSSTWSLCESLGETPYTPRLLRRDSRLHGPESDHGFCIGTVVIRYSDFPSGDFPCRVGGFGRDLGPVGDVCLTPGVIEGPSGRTCRQTSPCVHDSGTDTPRGKTLVPRYPPSFHRFLHIGSL